MNHDEYWATLSMPQWEWQLALKKASLKHNVRKGMRTKFRKVAEKVNEQYLAQVAARYEANLASDRT